MKAYVAQFQGHRGSEIGVRLAQLQTRIAGRLDLGLRSTSMRYGLRRDLAAPPAAPKSKIPITVRPLAPADVDALLPTDGPGDHHERLEIAWRRAFINKGPQGGFVAVDERNGTPCYMQWLFGAAQNPFVQRLGGFPALGNDETLLENAYTPPRYRGLGIMPAAMALIAERAASIGARYVLSFVDQRNIPSLKGCQKAGFYPHMLHHRTQTGFGLFKRDRFEILPDADPRRTMKF